MALALGTFAIGATEFLPAALLPTIADRLQVTLSAAGWLISGYAFGVTLMTPILTAVFSTWSRKRLLIGLMVLFAVTNLLAACSPNFQVLLVMRFVTAFSHGVYLAAATTAVAGLVPRGREAQGISILFSGLTIAMATVVPAGAILGQLLGWRMAFVVIASLGLLTAIAIARSVPELPASSRRLSLRQQLTALRQPRLLLALAMTSVGYAGSFTAFTYLAATLEQISGFRPMAVTALFALVGVGVTVGNLVGGWLADSGAHRAILLLFGCLLVCLLALWAAAASPLAVTLVLFPLGMVMFSPGAGLQLLAIGLARQAFPGTEDVAAGLNQSAFNLGIAGGAFVGGQVVASSLGLALTPLVGAALVLVAIGLTLWSCWLNRPE